MLNFPNTGPALMPCESPELHGVFCAHAVRSGGHGEGVSGGGETQRAEGARGQRERGRIPPTIESMREPSTSLSEAAERGGTRE